MSATILRWSLVTWLLGDTHRERAPIHIRTRDDTSDAEALAPARGPNPRSASAIRDIELVTRMREGDERALEALISAYAEWLVAIATPIVASPDLAQDVVQDVFIRLWDIRDSLSIRGSVAGYLYRAVCNRARNARAHEGAQHALAARVTDSLVHNEPHVANVGEANIASADFHRALDDALARLQPRARDIFLMRTQGDMSYAEIAETLGIGIPTVRVQMCRATKALATYMAPWLDPDGSFALRDTPTKSAVEPT